MDGEALPADALEVDDRMSTYVHGEVCQRDALRLTSNLRMPPAVPPDLTAAILAAVR